MMNGRAQGIPLCVDLDGTLLKTDTTWEVLLLFLKGNPLRLPLVLSWYLKGKHFMKERLSEKIVMDMSLLPVHSELLTFLKEEKQKGRELILVTGSAQKTADAMQRQLDIFSEVLGTGEGINLTGHKKAAMLINRYGEKGFDYAGNAAVDMKVWPHARRVIIVNASGRVTKKATALGTLERDFGGRKSLPKAFLRAVRPHQWMKNVLILVPLITSHQLADGAMVGRALIAFGAFCLCTSGVYLLNDLLDLASDRQHARKRYRPLASGDLPIPVALAAAPILMFSSLVVAAFLPPFFIPVIMTYVVTTFAYSFYLKQIVIIDVLLLAGLYTVRIIAGHAATGIPYSMWLLMFSMFFFLSLALVKRYSELEITARDNRENVAGRGYMASDRIQVGILGSASGYISALVLALYITSEQVTALYMRPAILWALIPLMLYWVSRIWLLASRGAVHDDPIVFTLKDSVSYVVGALIALTMFLSV
jgi:4-hydroxybenzoate polyprenyltransferase